MHFSIKFWGNVDSAHLSHLFVFSGAFFVEIIVKYPFQRHFMLFILADSLGILFNLFEPLLRMATLSVVALACTISIKHLHAFPTTILVVRLILIF